MKQARWLDSGIYALASIGRDALGNVPYRFDFTLQIDRKYRPPVAWLPGRAEVIGTIDVRSPHGVPGRRIAHASPWMNHCVIDFVSGDVEAVTTPRLSVRI
jgi:hypothetical protein